MAISYVQGGTGYTSVTLSATVAHNTLIVIIGAESGTTPMLSDDKSNSYSPLISQPSFYSGYSIYAYVASDIAAGTTTISLSGPTSPNIVVYEFSGIATSSPSDVTPTFKYSPGGVATYDGSDITTVTDGAVVFAGCFLDAARGSSAGTGWSGFRTFNANLGTLFAEFQIKATHGTVTMAACFSGVASLYHYDTVAVALKPVALVTIKPSLMMMGMGN